MRKLSKPLFLMSVCALYGWGMAPAEARTCFIVGDCGGYLSRKDTVSTTHSCEDLGYKYNKDECIAAGKVPTGRNCGDNYEKCLCSEEEYPWLGSQIAYPYTATLANSVTNPTCSDEKGVHYKYKVCQSQFVTTYTPYGTWLVNDSSPRIFYPIRIDLYNIDPMWDKYEETGECCHEYVGQTSSSNPYVWPGDDYDRDRCTGLICKRSYFKYDWEDIDDEEERLGTSGIFDIGEDCGDDHGDYVSSVSCSGSTTAIPSGETNVTGAWKAQCASTETYSQRFDATVDDVTCHWCYQKCDTSEYPWLEADILPPYTKTLANNITNPSCTDGDGTHYKYKVCQSRYYYTYDIYTVPRNSIYYDAYDTYGGGDMDRYDMDWTDRCLEIASQTGEGDLNRYVNYTCNRSYFPYDWEEVDEEEERLGASGIFNVGEDCGDSNGDYVSSLTCSGNTTHAPIGETHTTGAWKATCAGNETHNSQYDATVGGVTCHWCYAQPCSSYSTSGHTYYSGNDNCTAALSGTGYKCVNVTDTSKVGGLSGCYEMVAKTCSDWGYTAPSSTGYGNSCNGDYKPGYGTFWLGNEQKECVRCQNKICEDYGYSGTSHFSTSPTGICNYPGGWIQVYGEQYIGSRLNHCWCCGTNNCPSGSSTTCSTVKFICEGFNSTDVANLSITEQSTSHSVSCGVSTSSSPSESYWITCSATGSSGCSFTIDGNSYTNSGHITGCGTHVIRKSSY